MGTAGISRNRYIAVVDDDLSVCRALARLLRESGFQPITYLSAEQLLEDTKRPEFDCLMLDVQLGELSGLQLQQRLTDSGRLIPVIYITANDDPKTREQAERSGCIGYFRKTAPGSELLQAIQDALAKRDATP